MRTDASASAAMLRAGDPSLESLVVRSTAHLGTHARVGTTMLFLSTAHHRRSLPRNVGTSRHKGCASRFWGLELSTLVEEFANVAERIGLWIQSAQRQFCRVFVAVQSVCVGRRWASGGRQRLFVEVQ